MFFDSGEATLKPAATKLVDKIAGVVRDERTHPVVVEGHTDSQPISGSQYPSNWELSGARAGGGRPGLRRQRRPGPPDVPGRLRQPGADRIEFDARRAREEPPGGDRPHPHPPPTRSHTPSAWRRSTSWSRKSFQSSSLLAVLGGVYKFVLAKPAKAEEPKPKVHGTVYMLEKEFLVNLADGRFAKMQIGLVLAHDDVSTVAAGGHGAADAARGLRRRWPRRASSATSSPTC